MRVWKGDNLKKIIIVLLLVFVWVVYTFDGNVYKSHHVVQRGMWVFGYDENNHNIWMIPYWNVHSMEEKL
jgi:hypothetical protein